MFSTRQRIHLSYLQRPVPIKNVFLGNWFRFHLLMQCNLTCKEIFRTAFSFLKVKKVKTIGSANLTREMASKI